ncbi:MAG: hypothetical protein ACJ79K_13580 [Gemmatimonadaceae bacterium]
MRTRVRALIAAAALGLTARLPAQQAQQAPAAADSSTSALQAQVRQRMAAIVKQRLSLTDDQVRQLAVVNASYEGRRRDLIMRERQARVAIGRELQRGQSADQQGVDNALSDLFRIQRARIDLAEQEQRDLAKFMQPAQRAGYLALQEQMRRRIEQMRQRRR